MSRTAPISATWSRAGSTTRATRCTGPTWLKLTEAIEFAEAVDPRRVFPIHDAQLNDRGLAGVNGWFGETLGDRYRYLAPGESA